MSSDTLTDIFNDFVRPQKKDGIYYTWIPKPTNPSKLLLHKWVPEEDKWVPTVWATFLPSKAWDSLE